MGLLVGGSGRLGRLFGSCMGQMKREEGNIEEEGREESVLDVDTLGIAMRL